MIPRYNKLTKIRIRLPSRSPIHVENIVKGTSWKFRDLTSHTFNVFLYYEESDRSQTKQPKNLLNRWIHTK